MTVRGERSDFWVDRSVAVTGATGFIGAHVTGALIEAGAAVKVLVRDRPPPPGLLERWQERAQVVRLGEHDAGALATLLSGLGVRSICHLAAQSQVGAAGQDPVAAFEANIEGTWTVLEASRQSATVDEVVMASSDAVYGAQDGPHHESMPLLATHPYGVSKACGDMLATSYAATYGTNVCVTRCGNVFGPGDRSWDRLVPGSYRSLLQGRRPTIRSDGTMVRDYLYVEDLAALYLRLIEAMHDDPSLRGQAFNVSSERPMTVRQMLGLIQASLGSELEPEVLGRASGEVDEQRISSEKARRVLGWKPERTVEDALDLTAAWYRSEVLGA